jgi:hypothetical protein
MRQIGRTIALGILIFVAALASESKWGEARAQGLADIDARVVATNIPGASAIAQVGTFVMPRPKCCLLRRDPWLPDFLNSRKKAQKQ